MCFSAVQSLCEYYTNWSYQWLRLWLVKQPLRFSFTAGINLVSSYVCFMHHNINCLIHMWSLDADILCLWHL